VFQNHDRIAGILIFATGAFLFHNSLDFPEESAQFPRMILGLWMVLSGWMVLRSFVVADWRNTIIYIPVMAWLLGYRSKTVIIASTAIYLGVVLVVFDILFERELPEEFFMQ
jgi:hypothetical protein